MPSRFSSKGLKRLEYRGYDSAGIAVIHDAQLDIRKAVGKLKNRRRSSANDPPTGTIGIDHYALGDMAGHRAQRIIRMKPQDLSSCITASSRIISPCREAQRRGHDPAPRPTPR
jgi:glucosamine 6-phosphate synthetase-like amidotransferase/phosphosugar isomerase protein